MSNNFVNDICIMHDKYAVKQSVKKMNSAVLKSFLEFRIKFLQEELNELINSESGDDAVDALIDLVVVAIGTLDAFDVDIELAWNRVLEANMSKEVGMKESRKNDLGLPDLIKPTGWIAPNHADNVGLFSVIKWTPPTKDRYSVQVLLDAIDLQRKKGADYQSTASTIKQADYYLRGIDSIYDTMHGKMLRMKSIMDIARTGSSPNFESLQDSSKDLINYSSFFCAYLEGKIDGQTLDKDIFNRPLK